MWTWGIECESVKCFRGCVYVVGILCVCYWNVLSHVMENTSKRVERTGDLESILSQSFTSCVTMGKLRNLSELQLPDMSKKFCTSSNWDSTGNKCQGWFAVCVCACVCVRVCVCVAVEIQAGGSSGLTAAFSCTIVPTWQGSPARCLPWPTVGTTVPAFSPFSTTPMAAVWLWCGKGDHRHATGDLWLCCCYDSLLKPLWSGSYEAFISSCSL